MILTQPQDTRVRCDSCKKEWNRSDFHVDNYRNLAPGTKTPERITMGYVNCGPGGIGYHYDLCGDCVYKALKSVGVVQ